MVLDHHQLPGKLLDFDFLVHTDISIELSRFWTIDFNIMSDKIWWWLFGTSELKWPPVLEPFKILNSMIDVNLN